MSTLGFNGVADEVLDAVMEHVETEAYEQVEC